MKRAIQSVSRNRITDQIVKQLVDLIIAGEVQPGDRLPSERELAEDFAVSRTAMREAIRALTAQGLLAAQQGSGTFVLPPDSWNALDPVVLLAKGKSIALDELFEALAFLEPHVASLAATNATPDEILAISQYARLTTSREEHVQVDVGFHMSVARASHCRVLLIMLNSVNELMHFSCRDNLGGQLQSVREEVYRAHYRVFERIRDHDSDGAFLAMQDHLRAAWANYRSIIAS